MNFLKKYLALVIASCAAIYLYYFAPRLDLMPYPLAAAVILFAIILACIFKVAHNADCLAEILGDPYGTLILTGAATIIEVAVMMTALTHGEGNPSFVRDMISSTLFIVLGGMTGLSMMIGGFLHPDQNFNTHGAHMYLSILIPLAIVTLVLPDFTVHQLGTNLGLDQVIFFATIVISLYGLFIFAQTKRHQSFFLNTESNALPETKYSNKSPENHSSSHSKAFNLKEITHLTFWLSISLLLSVLLIEKLAILINYEFQLIGFPVSLNGITIAVLVLAPEWIASLNAARANHLQRSLNIALGSGIATLSLTVPIILCWAAINHVSIELGLPPAQILLLLSSLWVSHVALSTGKSNLVQGAVLFLFFIVTIFLIFNP